MPPMPPNIMRPSIPPSKNPPMPAKSPRPKPPPMNERLWNGLREEPRAREREPKFERLEKPLRPKPPNPREPRNPKERNPPKRLASACSITRLKPSDVRVGAPRCAGARNNNANNKAMRKDFMENLRMRPGPKRKRAIPRTWIIPAIET